MAFYRMFSAEYHLVECYSADKQCSAECRLLNVILLDGILFNVTLANVMAPIMRSKSGANLNPYSTIMKLQKEKENSFFSLDWHKKNFFFFTAVSVSPLHSKLKKTFFLHSWHLWKLFQPSLMFAISAKSLPEWSNGHVQTCYWWFETLTTALHKRTSLLRYK
jgi:hypothetical protein